MKHYRITDAQGATAYEYTADAQVDFPAWQSPEFTTTEVVDAPPVAPEYSGSWQITKLAFRNRFTQAEKVATEIAALDVPAAPMQQRAMAAALRSSQQDVTVATFIDLKRADTRAGVQTLETAGLLAAGRAAAILDTPPTAVEVWNG